jgi:hypothetical protein
VAIHNRHDFQAFAALGCADLAASPLAIANVASRKRRWTEIGADDNIFITDNSE